MKMIASTNPMAQAQMIPRVSKGSQVTVLEVLLEAEVLLGDQELESVVSQQLLVDVGGEVEADAGGDQHGDDGVSGEPHESEDHEDGEHQGEDHVALLLVVGFALG